MELNILERITALSILPKEGSYATLKVLRDLQMALSLKEEEYKEFGVKEDKETGQVTWNVKGQEQREIEIGEKASDLIKDALKKLNDEKKLTAQHMSLYEKFIDKKLE